MSSLHLQDIPLKDPSREFRLLKIKPGRTRKSAPELSLSSHLIDTAPEYVAVSYEWGINPPRQRVMINGVGCAIRENLWHCLQVLQRRALAKYYWIDAISIDQTDANERGHQVQQMGRIYSKAQFTLAWIGTGDKETSSALQFMGQSQSRILKVYQEKPEEARSITLTLADIFNRTYWRRLWVVQEILLARKTIVVCETDAFDLTVFEQFIKILCEHDEADREPLWSEFYRLQRQKGNTAAYEFLDAHNEWWKPHRHITRGSASAFVEPAEDTDLRQSLESGTQPDAGCLDIRDKVFGLLGLDDDMRDFQVDYSVGRSQLYVDVLLHPQRKHPNMPAVFCSVILQKTLCLTGMGRETEGYITSFRKNEAIPTPIFRDYCTYVGSVLRVGCTFSSEANAASDEDLETIRMSLGVDWRDTSRSFSGRNYTESQKEIVRLYMTRSDMFGRLDVAPDKLAYATYLEPRERPSQILLQQKELDDLLIPEEERWYSQFRRHELFLTTTHRVGIGFPRIQPGDLLLMANGNGRIMLALRESPGRPNLYRIVSRAYVLLDIDSYEQHIARSENEANITWNNEDHWPNCNAYWAPQLSGHQLAPPFVMEKDILDVDNPDHTFQLHLDIESLVDMTALSIDEVGRSLEELRESQLDFKARQESKSGQRGFIQRRAI